MLQHFYYQRVAPGLETTVRYEESGALVHITWYLETRTTHRFAALPAWLAKDMSVYRGDNQDPAFIEKIRKLSLSEQDWPRHIGLRPNHSDVALAGENKLRSKGINQT
jgi:hypothetical protein